MHKHRSQKANVLLTKLNLLIKEHGINIKREIKSENYKQTMLSFDKFVSHSSQLKANPFLTLAGP